MRHSPMLLALCLACDTVSGGGGNGGGDAGTGPSCPPKLPEAAVSCTRADCQATTGTKTFAQASLASATGKDWVVVSWAIDELSTAGVDLDYHKAARGALTAARPARERPAPSPEIDAIVNTPERLARLEHERRLRAWRHPGYDLGALDGTAIAARPDPKIPGESGRQVTSCAATTPKTCGASAVCVLAPGAAMGQCASALTLKFFDGTPAKMVNATVKKVGEAIAVATDDADPAVDASTIDAIVDRFERHIAPRVHQFFGPPTSQSTMRDRDGNGVVIVLLSAKVSGGGARPLVGFFQPVDMEDPAQNANSNGADLLYMRPPGGPVSLDQLSGTLAHEYEHLINFVAKTSRQSSPEELWLDEGLAGFAEDITGYGRDAFTNVLAYLQEPGSTSLNGAGLTGGDPDTFSRRGMAHLLVRHIFERAGGASFPDGPGAATDRGGVAAIRGMVQSADTGSDAVTKASKKTWGETLRAMLMTVAVDGTSLSCLPELDFAAPETDAFTMFQRGIDLRKPVAFPGGSLPLAGPVTTTFEMETGVPLPMNSGEFRTVTVASGVVDIAVGGPADSSELQVGLRAFVKP